MRQFILAELEVRKQELAELSDEQLMEIAGGIRGAAEYAAQVEERRQRGLFNFTTAMTAVGGVGGLAFAHVTGSHDITTAAAGAIAANVIGHGVQCCINRIRGGGANNAQPDLELGVLNAHHA